MRIVDGVVASRAAATSAGVEDDRATAGAGACRMERAGDVLSDVLNDAMS